MNNEPVGYFLYNEEYKEWEETHAGTPNSVPLYTHPAELTDEEIEEVWNKVLAEPPYDGTADRIGNFARAILRKAQEVNPT